MKKLFLIFNVMLIFLITTIGRVKAYEEPVGYFFGKEYPIIYNDPNIMPLYDVNGYSISAYYRDITTGGSYTSYNQAVMLTSGHDYYFRFNVSLPENIDSGTTFTFYTTFLKSGLTGFELGDYVEVYGPGTASKQVDDVQVSQNSDYSVMVNSGDINCSFPVSTINIYIKATATSTNCSLYVTDIDISKNNIDAYVGYIAGVVGLIQADTDSMVGILNAIVDGLVGIINYLPNLAQDSTLSSVGSNIVSAINSASSSIVSSINDMKTFLGNKLDSGFASVNVTLVNLRETLVNTLNDLMGENQDTTNATNKNDSTTNDFENISGQYDDIEHSAVEDFENNLANVDTDTDLLNVADFKSTSNFIATNLTNIYNSHDYIGNMIIFSLVIGFSLTLIGIKVRR